MRRIPTALAGSLIVAALAVWLRPAVAEVERPIGPGVLSLPELAVRLSSPGGKVRCAHELQSRAAYISLQARPLAEQRELLSAGLGVRFRRDGGDWLLEWDPDLRQKERARLSRYSALARRRVREQIGDVIDSHGGKTRRQFFAEIEKLQEPTSAEGAGGFYGADGPDHATAFETVASARQQRLLQLQAISSTAGWKAVQLLADPRGLEACIRRGGELRAGFGEDPPVSERSSPRAPQPVHKRTPAESEHERRLLGVWLDPIRRTLRVGTRYASATTADDGARSDVEIPFEPDLPALLDEVGNGDAADRAAEIRATQKLLESPDAAVPIPLDAPGGADCTSRFIEEWSRATQRDAVMLLWPEREQAISQPSGSRFTLADWFARDARSRAAEHWLTRGFGWRPTQEQLAEVTARALHASPLEQSPWSLREQDGVLLVTNRLAFLDRESDYPLAELLPVIRTARWDAPGPTRSPLPGVSYDELARYATSVSPARNGVWWRLGTVVYRGIPIHELATAAAFVPLIERLDPARRDVMRGCARGGMPVELLLTRNSRGDLGRLRSSLRAFGLDYPECWHPAFASGLTRLELNVRSRQAAGSISAEISFDLHDMPPLDRAHEEWIPQLTLSGGGLRVW